MSASISYFNIFTQDANDRLGITISSNNNGESQPWKRVPSSILEPHKFYNFDKFFVLFLNLSRTLMFSWAISYIEDQQRIKLVFDTNFKNSQRKLIKVQTRNACVRIVLVLG